MSIGKASSSLAGLANEIQSAIEELSKQGMKLAEEIRVVDRKHLELDVESMKLKTKDRRSDFFDSARGLLMEKSNEWFAFFHMQS
ncbi:MAG: hypothetical protein PXY39_05310 [archaeon]|nr:hypothetical protein [archaeon]